MAVIAKPKKRMASIFQRTEEMSPGSRISAARYNLIIGSVLCWGFLVNWLMVKFIPYESVASIHWLTFLISYFVSCLVGILLITRSRIPIVSFIGYNLVVVPFGLIINRVVHRYDPLVVLDAIRVTGLVTLVMMVLGSLLPVFFKKIKAALAIALLGVIAIELIEVYVFQIHHGFIDWIIVVIFCGYIGYDWARANSIPKTTDNAVDCAAALYIDIINLFLRMLRIIGRRR